MKKWFRSVSDLLDRGGHKSKDKHSRREISSSATDIDKEPEKYDESGDRRHGSIGEKLQNWMRTSECDLTSISEITEENDKTLTGSANIKCNKTNAASEWHIPFPGRTNGIGHSRTSLCTINEDKLASTEDIAVSFEKPNKKRDSDTIKDTEDSAIGISVISKNWQPETNFNKSDQKDRKYQGIDSGHDDECLSEYAQSSSGYNTAGPQDGSICTSNDHNKGDHVRRKQRSSSDGDSGNRERRTYLPQFERSASKDKETFTKEFVENNSKNIVHSNSATEVTTPSKLLEKRTDTMCRSCSHIPQTTIHLGSYSSVQINTSGTGSSVSEPSRSASVPQMVTYNCPPIQQGIQDSTRCQLQTHIKEGRTILTQAVHDSIDVFTKDKGPRVAIILGHENDGKTCTGNNIMYQLPDEHWQKAIVVSPAEWKAVDVYEKNRKTVVFIDNIFGRNAFEEKTYRKWERHFNDIYSKAQHGNVAVIIAMRKRIFQNYISKYSPHELFAEHFIVDITTYYTYTGNDKIAILKGYLSRFPDAKEILFTEDRERENIDSFYAGDTLYISEETLNSISESTETFGFPKQANEYAKKIENIAMRSDFFRRPLDFHCISISSLMESDKTSTFALAMIYENKGTIDMERVGNFQKKRKAQKKYIPKQSVWKKAKTTQQPPMIQSLALGLEDPDNIASCVRNGATKLDNWLVNFESEDSVTFCSTAIHNGVGLVYGKRYATDVIRYAPRDFIFNFVAASRGKTTDEMQIEIHKNTPTDTLNELMLRLANDSIDHCNVSDVCNHSLMRHMWFASTFVGYIKQRDKAREFLQARDVLTHETVLCHGMDNQFHRHKTMKDSEPSNITEMLVAANVWQKQTKDPILKNRQEKHALNRSCKLGIYSTFACILKDLHPALDTDCLELATLVGSIEIVSDILKKKPFSFTDLCRMLSLVCKTYCSTNPDLGKKLAEMLMAKNASIDRRSKKFPPLIHDAVEENNVDLLTMLHTLGCDLELMNNKGERPLHVCARNGHAECTKLLLQYEVDPAKQNRQHQLPIHTAIENGNFEIVTLLVETTTCIEAKDSNEMRPLHLAIKHWIGMDMLKYLIHQNADVNAEDIQGKTPLYIAMQEEQLGNQQLDAVSELMAAGALMHKQDHNGDTPIRIAFSNRNIEVVKFLVEEKTIDINSTSNGKFLLHIAIMANSIEICKLVIENGSDLLAKQDGSGKNALHLACRYANIDIVDLLLKEPTLITLKNKKGRIPLHTAAKYGRSDIVQRLIDVGSDPKAKGTLPNYITPYQLALRERNLYSKMCNMEQARKCDIVLSILRKAINS